jgi:hypothetical protein
MEIRPFGHITCVEKEKTFDAYQQNGEQEREGAGIWAGDITPKYLFILTSRAPSLQNVCLVQLLHTDQCTTSATDALPPEKI